MADKVLSKFLKGLRYLSVLGMGYAAGKWHQARRDAPRLRAFGKAASDASRNTTEALRRRYPEGDQRG